jgi:hypothetical protein
MPVETCELNYLDFDSNREMYGKRRELKAAGWKVTENTKKCVKLVREVAKPAARRSRRR